MRILKRSALPALVCLIASATPCLAEEYAGRLRASQLGLALETRSKAHLLNANRALQRRLAALSGVQVVLSATPERGMLRVERLVRALRTVLGTVEEGPKLRTSLGLLDLRTDESPRSAGVLAGLTTLSAAHPDLLIRVQGWHSVDDGRFVVRRFEWSRRLRSGSRSAVILDYDPAQGAYTGGRWLPLRYLMPPRYSAFAEALERHLAGSGLVLVDGHGSDHGDTVTAELESPAGRLLVIRGSVSDPVMRVRVAKPWTKGPTYLVEARGKHLLRLRFVPSGLTPPSPALIQRIRAAAWRSGWPEPELPSGGWSFLAPGVQAASLSSADWQRAEAEGDEFAAGYVPAVLLAAEARGEPVLRTTVGARTTRVWPSGTLAAQLHAALEPAQASGLRGQLSKTTAKD